MFGKMVISVEILDLRCVSTCGVLSDFVLVENREVVLGGNTKKYS